MGELIIDLLVGFLVAEPVHPGSSPRLGTGARIFLDLFISRFNGVMLSMVDDVVNLEICRLIPSEVLVEIGFAYLCS
jgi:hypothetical protein